MIIEEKKQKEYQQKMSEIEKRQELIGMLEARKEDEPFLRNSWRSRSFTYG